MTGVRLPCQLAEGWKERTAEQLKPVHSRQRVTQRPMGRACRDDCDKDAVPLGTMVPED